MAPTEALLVAAFDPKSLLFVVIGHPEMRFSGEHAARRAGCIVMPQTPRTGVIRGLSSTEVIVSHTAFGLRSAAPRPPVISKVPGTLWQPPGSRQVAHPEPAPPPASDAPRARRRG